MLPSLATPARRTDIGDRFRRVRQASMDMCAGLEPAEYRLQPAEEVSPPWWNLGHTSWFFARNVLLPLGGERTDADEVYDYLLNSYYASLGDRLPRGQRGLVTRPTTDEIYSYRSSVDERMERLIETLDDDRLSELESLLRIGVEHEQQHQELFYTEIKYILAQNPVALRRPFRTPSRGRRVEAASRPSSLTFTQYAGGLFEFGNLEGGWCWDNELPVHRNYLEPFEIADRLATNREFLEFIDDGGHRNQLLWLDNGWQQLQANRWKAPLYWQRIDGQWHVWTLSGMRPLDAHDPVCHVSFYEADAFARWQSETFAELQDVHLPSERQWEHAARQQGTPLDAAAFLESDLLHPTPAGADMCGVVWQWTSSYYEPYPGYRPFPGALAEYNGKFMDNQRVLRGGSCVTPRDHFRISYRNFWPPETRFQFTGVRLARDLGR